MLGKADLKWEFFESKLTIENIANPANKPFAPKTFRHPAWDGSARHSAPGRRTRKMARRLALLLLCACALARAEILTPPYINLALGKKITATATCGDEGPELYCKLVGANADHDEHVIQGQVKIFVCKY